jgi:hypothetical protein
MNFEKFNTLDLLPFYVYIFFLGSVFPNTHLKEVYMISAAEKRTYTHTQFLFHSFTSSFGAATHLENVSPALSQFYAPTAPVSSHPLDEKSSAKIQTQAG